MAVFSRTTHEGYLFVDHRASPGLPEDMAILAGYNPAEVRGGKVFETFTLGCNHCGCHVVMNPNRQRPRNYCPKCDRYICDICEGVRTHPDYVHRTIGEIADLLRTGKWVLSGSMSFPKLTPIQWSKI